MRRVLALLGLLAFVLLATPAPASAHASLLRTDPPAGAVLPNAPRQLTLVFTESVRPIDERFVLLGPDRSRIAIDKPATSGDEVRVLVAGELGTGTYLLSYRVVSADGHPIGGAFSFSVGAPSAQAPTADDLESVRIEPSVAIAFGAARWLGYAGLVLLVGPLLFLSVLWPQRLSRRIPAYLVLGGVAATTLSTLAAMYLQGPYTNGGNLLSTDGVGDGLAGRYGAALAVRLGVLAAIVGLLRPFLTAPGPSRVDRIIMSVLGLIGLTTWPVAGHPGASPVPVLSVIADLAHLAAMAVWLGGLVMLIGVVLWRADMRELGAILPEWSTWAMLAVTALVFTGTAQSLIEITSFAQLWETTYGRLVLLKIGLLAIVIAVAAVSRSLVRRASIETLRGTVVVELGVTAIVLALAASLVQTPPARSAANQGADQPYSVTVEAPLYRLRIDVSPARTGANSIHLFALTPAGQPQRVVEWKGTAASPSLGIEPITIPLLAITEDHAVGEVELATPGDWELRFTVRISDVDQASVVHTLRVQ